MTSLNLHAKFEDGEKKEKEVSKLFERAMIVLNDLNPDNYSLEDFKIIIKLFEKITFKDFGNDKSIVDGLEQLINMYNKRPISYDENRNLS